jgi:signal transduction histidine kinase
MPETTAPGHDYPAHVERLCGWLRRHPWLADGTLAIVLLAGSANEFGNPAVLPASLALAGVATVRRRFPVGAYIAALAIGIAQVIGGIGPTFTQSPLQPTFADAGILVLLYTVAADRPRRISMPGLAACMAVFAAAVARWNPGSGARAHPVEFALVTGVFYVLAPVTAWVLGESMAYRRARLTGLEERAVRAERERDIQAQIAAAAERARIARELHDVIAHNLSVIVAQADGARYAFDAQPVRSRQALAQIGDTGRQALAEMSHLLGVLRTDAEAPTLAPAPGVAEIGRLVTQAREAGMSISYTMEGAFRPLPIGLSMAAYRMVQEALTNVRKHAAPGAPARVTLCYGRDELLVRVADAGHGPAGRPSSLPRYGPDRTVGTVRPDGDGGQGLAGMRERAVIYGGTVQAGPRPGGGFEVSARLPLPLPTAAPPAGATPAGPPHAGRPMSREAG